jgi:DNA-binding PadR family transcriptional regulator
MRTPHHEDITLKGHLRLLVLRLLGEQEMSGYALMKAIGKRMGRKPSAGSMYPLLEELKASGLVSSKEEGKSKLYLLTKEGRSELGSLGKDACFNQVLSSVRMYCLFSGENEPECARRLAEFFDKEKKEARKVPR